MDGNSAAGCLECGHIILCVAAYVGAAVTICGSGSCFVSGVRHRKFNVFRRYEKEWTEVHSRGFQRTCYNI